MALAKFTEMIEIKPTLEVYQSAFSLKKNINGLELVKNQAIITRTNKEESFQNGKVSEAPLPVSSKRDLKKEKVSTSVKAWVG
ncbi:hypothetical protein TNIN_176701 [Trichonephila inaurata madagascariensis]|uniref:Uncharacterized protein n=1 Tax=Trichonephila inaurata madagascariensis TaxID=2747483 RepID=A0A8X7CEF3_9ARAC|nr:hypothetical protein TNIN_176701 [Trichonephila inaurata madagascariensis]